MTLSPPDTVHHPRLHTTSSTTSSSSSITTTPSGMNPTDHDSVVKFKGCWATLMTKEHLLPGLVVFAHSLLRLHSSQYPLVVMITESLSLRAISILEKIPGILVRLVFPIYPTIQSTDLAYPRFGEVWTKLRAWELQEYDRVVLVDNDMLVCQNMDELFFNQNVFHPSSSSSSSSSSDWIAASYACTCNPNQISTYPDDWIPSNCGFTFQSVSSSISSPLQPSLSSSRPSKLINSGLVVLKPCSKTLDQMIEKINSNPIEIAGYRFPDQDFLADWFQDRIFYLSWCYNALKKLRIIHTNIWRDDQVKNVHYILDKPWNLGKPGSLSNPNDIDQVTHSWWWKTFDMLRDISFRTNQSHPNQWGSLPLSEPDWKECIEKYVNLST